MTGAAEGRMHAMKNPLSLWLHFHTACCSMFRTWHLIHSSKIRHTIIPKQHAEARRRLARPVTDWWWCCCCWCVCVCVVVFAPVTLSTAPTGQDVCEHPGSPFKLVGHYGGIHIKGQLGAEVCGAADKDTGFWAAEHRGANGPDTGC